MNFMNLLKVGCSEVKVHVDMFLTNHVHFHRRLSELNHTKLSTSNVTMDPNFYNNLHRAGGVDNQMHQVALHNQQPIRLGDNPDDPDDVRIDYDMIEEVAERMKELGDEFYRERTASSVSHTQKMMEKYIPRLAICGFAAYTVYKVFGK